jgi:hypothetical protein
MSTGDREIIASPLPFPMPTTPLYPPGTNDPALSATPQRTTVLNTRGTMIPCIDAIMAELQVLYPRRIFPAEGTVDQARQPVIDPVGWRRGGTSPSGADLGAPSQASYFIGWNEQFINAAAPQRIVWEPPEDGAEEILPGQQLGPFIDRLLNPRPDLLVPASPVTQDYYRQMGEMAAAPWGLRVIPMRAHLWANDWSDSEELIHWFAGAVQNCLNGTINGSWNWQPGGYARGADSNDGAVSKASRGVQYVCTVRLPMPLHYPYFREVEARQALLRFDGAAPYSVVSE